MDSWEIAIRCPISWYVIFGVKELVLTRVPGQGPNGLNDAGRTATLIHEATHQLAKTGDDINQKGNIIKPYDGRSKPSGETGCACPKLCFATSIAYLDHRYEQPQRTHHCRPSHGRHKVYKCPKWGK